jgi:hypothetical protein
MYSGTKAVLSGVVLGACALVAAPDPGAGQTSPTGGQQQIELGKLLADGKLRAVNREVTKLPEACDGIHVSEKAGNGVVWVEGSDFADGTIELDIRGRDVFQQSFVGVAFHRKDDGTYDCVYLRPFNFRAEDPVRKQHAVQYMALPDYDWPRLRKEFPEEFENPVDPSLVPTDWVPLKVVVKAKAIQIFVGPVATPTLEVKKLGQHDRGLVGLWTGNGSNGDFSNLRVTPMK